MKRVFFNDEKETKKIFIIALSVFIIAILACVITFVIYSDAVEKELKIAEIKSSITEDTTSTSTTIGKTIKQVIIEDDNNDNDKEETKEKEVNKIAINTSNMVKTNVTDEIKNEDENNEEEEAEETIEEIIPDPVFERPVEGEIIRKYAKDDLVYSDTLEEWITHFGIDIKAPKTSIVKAAEAGKNKAIKNDPR